MTICSELQISQDNEFKFKLSHLTESSVIFISSACHQLRILIILVGVFQRPVAPVGATGGGRLNLADRRGL